MINLGWNLFEIKELAIKSQEFEKEIVLKRKLNESVFDNIIDNKEAI